MNLVNNKPQLSNKKGTAVDNKITNCTDCKRGIFKFHTYKWTSRGLVHIDCKEVTREVEPSP